MQEMKEGKITLSLLRQFTEILLEIEPAKDLERNK